MITAPNGFQFGRAASGYLVHLAPVRGANEETLRSPALCGQVITYSSRSGECANSSRLCDRCYQAQSGRPNGGTREGSGRPMLDPDGETTPSTVQFTPGTRRAVEHWRQLIRARSGGTTVPSYSETVRTMIQTAADLERLGARRALQTMRSAIQ